MTKKNKLRHSEYYDLQDCFDKLYAKSKQGDVFTNLMEIISSEENIRLAYRNIKRNSGSHTSGVDNVSNIALNASAEILAKVNEKSVEDMFENLRNHLIKGYRAYADRGKMFSKTDTMEKSHFEAIKHLRNYPATKEQMKNIAKSLFDLADSALKCSTEQQMQEQEEAPRQDIEIKMSM